MAGEYGLGKNKTAEILDVLAKGIHDYQVIAIAGKNKKMQETFEDIVKLNLKRKSIKVLPFTNKVPELMAIADLVITKPGGLTISESLTSKLPIVVINPIPGQEEENAEFLEKSGCAVWIKKDSDPKELLESLLNDVDKLNKMKKISTKLSKPDATERICNISIKGEE